MPTRLSQADTAPKPLEFMPVFGRQVSIGNGFEAVSFLHNQFDGAMDPLLMVDHFLMTQPTFGPHAHAGLSAVSVLFEDSIGAFNNRDSIGNNIDLQPGDLYWLKAGRGAVHEEKPRSGARTHGLQVFVNLPARMKYDAPDSLLVRAAEMPTLVGDGYKARIVLGGSAGLRAASAPTLPMTIVDVTLEGGARFAHTVPSGQTAFVLSIIGSLELYAEGLSSRLEADSATVIRASDRAQTLILSAASKTQFVILQSAPLNEPFVHRGPFAMSTAREVRAMFAAHAAGELGSLDGADINPASQHIERSNP